MTVLLSCGVTILASIMPNTTIHRAVVQTNRTLAKKFARYAGISRYVHNWAIVQFTEHYCQTGKKLNYCDLFAAVREMRKSVPWLKRVPVGIIKNSLKNLTQDDADIAKCALRKKKNDDIVFSTDTSELRKKNTLYIPMFGSIAITPPVTSDSVPTQVQFRFEEDKWIAEIQLIDRPIVSEDGTDKVCTKCRRVLKLTCFMHRKKHGYASMCKRCVDERDTLYRRSEKQAAYVDKLRQTGKIRLYHVKSNYGLTAEQYTKLLEAYPVCAVYGNEFTKREPHVDHCHKSGTVRGLLCRACNLLLGTAKDNIVILESAALYLKRSSSLAICEAGSRQDAGL